MTIRPIATRLICFAVALSVSMVTTPVSAVIFNVTPQDDWFEMLNGPGFLQPGDEMVFGAGTYDASGQNINIRYRGTAANPITIRAATGANVKFTRGVNEPRNMFNLLGVQHLTIKGLEVTGGSTAFRVQQDGNILSKFLTLDSNHMHDIAGQGIAANSVSVGGVNNTYEGFHIVNNEIHNVGAEGEAMYLGCNYDECQMFDSVIEKNYVHDLVDTGNPSVDFQGDGIELKYGSYNNIIRDNVIHHIGYDTAGNVVAGPFPGISVYGTAENTPGDTGRNIVEGNVIWDAAGIGIQVAADTIIRNNIISSGLDGIQIKTWQGPDPFPAPQTNHPGNLDIVNNSIHSNVNNVAGPSGKSGHGINVQNPNGGTWAGPILIANNALYPDEDGVDNQNGFYRRSIGNYQLAPGSDITLTNNVGSEPHTSASEVLSSDILGSLAADVVDFQNINFFPKAGGSLIGSSSASDQPSDDFNRTSRSGSNDVGAYRYSSSGNPGWTIAPGFKEFPAGTSVGNGDFDGDGDTDGADFLLWQRVYNEFLTASDLTDWANGYGAGGGGSPGSAVANVPEPGAISLWSLGVACLFMRKRRRA